MSLMRYDSDYLEDALLLFLIQMDESSSLTDSMQGSSSEGISLPSFEDFVVRVDVQHFKPEEIKVRLKDGYVVVEGRHEEREDEHGYISREFVRRFLVPSDVEMSAFQSSVSSDGVLTVWAEKKAGDDLPVFRSRLPAAFWTSLDQLHSNEDTSQ